MTVDKNRIQYLTREFLIAIGEDPEREGLKDTPRRVADMYDELLDPEQANAKYTIFEADNYDGVVFIRDIDFSSICEHHLLPFIGVVHIAYIPQDKIIGISKLARIVDKHAKKLQLQERMTSEIVQDIEQAVSPKGVAIYIEAKHLCMNIRGIKRRNASTVTTMYTGSFQESTKQKQFMNIINNK